MSPDRWDVSEAARGQGWQRQLRAVRVCSRMCGRAAEQSMQLVERRCA